MRMDTAIEKFRNASIAQLAEHALRKRTVVGSIPTGGFFEKTKKHRHCRLHITVNGRVHPHFLKSGTSGTV